MRQSFASILKKNNWPNLSSYDAAKKQMVHYFYLRAKSEIFRFYSNSFSLGYLCSFVYLVQVAKGIFESLVGCEVANQKE
jgi:hypothetical protein